MFLNARSSVFKYGTCAILLTIFLMWIRRRDEKIVHISNTSSALPVISSEESILDITQCYDKALEEKFEEKGHFWIFTNFFPARAHFKCHESVTYTTHSDFTNLDNLIPLVERWQGPVSVAIHAPGDDFTSTVDSIEYLRHCETPLIKEYVSFHLYFNYSHFPQVNISKIDRNKQNYNCSLDPPYKIIQSEDSYRKRNNILYPINVGRNAAREAAQTYFLLASDIELYPNPNLIQRFLKMISQNRSLIEEHERIVFPLVLFEVASDQNIPSTKSQLQLMLKSNKAIPFHAKVCPSCHNVPKFNEWVASEEKDTLEVFHVAKRVGQYRSWEPLYIGTNREPYYDERFYWEGMRDKMSQAYLMCVMDYDFAILDSAFLVHKPGIKYNQIFPGRWAFMNQQVMLTFNVVHRELTKIVGSKPECAI